MREGDQPGSPLPDGYKWVGGYRLETGEWTVEARQVDTAPIPPSPYLRSIEREFGVKVGHLPDTLEQRWTGKRWECRLNADSEWREVRDTELNRG